MRIRFVWKKENQSREIISLYLFVFERDILDFTPWKSDFRCKPVILFINIETTSINTKPQICISLILKCQNARSVSRFKFLDYTFIHVVVLEYTLISDMVLITENSMCLLGAIKYACNNSARHWSEQIVFLHLHRYKLIFSCAREVGSPVKTASTMHEQCRLKNLSP